MGGELGIFSNPRAYIEGGGWQCFQVQGHLSEVKSVTTRSSRSRSNIFLRISHIFLHIFLTYPAGGEGGLRNSDFCQGVPGSKISKSLKPGGWYNRG